MGKKKDKKFRASKPTPTGLPSVKDNDCELMEESCPNMIQNVLEQLQSAEESTRECGCGTLASLSSQPQAVPVLLSNNVVRILAPLVVDCSPSVRHRALGALRNMTVDGGLDVCHDMVLKDVLTPLVALFKQYGINWEPEKSKNTKHSDTKLDIFIQAVHVLWNLCEASDVAVKVFNKETLLPLLLPCLQHSVYGYPLATAVAQCLQTVTESNAEAVELCRSDDVLPMLKSLADGTDASSHAMLFKAALMGTVMNVLGGELTAGAGLSPFVLTLAQILDVSGPDLIANYAAKSKAQQNGVAAMTGAGDADHHSATPGEKENGLDAMAGASDADHHSASLGLVGEEEEAPVDRDLEDVLNTLDAQRLCLELITNLCCSPEEEWEEVDSSESGSSDEMSGTADTDQDMGMAADNNNFDPLCAPSEVHAAFVAHNILTKVSQLSMPLPEELETVVRGGRWGRRVSKKLAGLRSHALLCLNNLVEGLPADAVGGVEALHRLWDTLALQLKATAGVKASAANDAQSSPSSDCDLLEATTGAMRAVIQKLVPLGSPKFADVTVGDIHFLGKVAEGAGSSVQIHVLRIVATIATLLVKADPRHAVIQEVGGCLVTAATHSPDLVVVGEALDALFDVFADDATDHVAQTLQLTDKLRAIGPQLKAKLQSQRKSLGEDYVTVATARKNLIRFIKYKESQGKC